MEQNEFGLIEHRELADIRITSQFYGKQNIIKIFNVLYKEILDLQDALYQLQTLRTIDLATGAQLDNIGEIVGYPREAIVRDFQKFFGFAGHPNAGTFGSVSNPAVGSPWYSLGQRIATYSNMTDDEYRFVLKAKIIKNYSFGTAEDLIAACNVLFNEKCRIIEKGNANIEIVVPRTLTDEEKGLIFNPAIGGTLLPIPICVGYQVIESLEHGVPSLVLDFNAESYNIYQR